MLKNALFTLIFLLALAACTSEKPTYSNDVLWLIDVLELTEESVVADIGAGNGRQAIEVARYIGSDGMVYATELVMRNSKRSCRVLREEILKI